MASPKDFLKKLSYHPVLVKLTKSLGLRKLLRAGYFYVNRPRDGVLTCTVENTDFNIRIANASELRLAESIVHEHGELPVIGSLVSATHDGDVVFDIGANIGIYTVALAQKTGFKGKVIAFEPEEKSHQRLAENVQLNGLTNVMLIKKALGDTNGKSQLYLGDTTGNFSLVKPYEQTDHVQTIDVVRGDDFIIQNNLPTPAVVKIDVEGFEYSVLQGLKHALSHSACRVLCCEIHPGLFPQGVQESMILDFITSVGFSKIQTFKREFSAYHVIAKKS